MYNKRTWLNKPDSSSTGEVVAYDGIYKNALGECTKLCFLSVGDCYSKARLHKNDEDTYQDFIDKMKLLRDDINEFIEYLEKNHMADEI